MLSTQKCSWLKFQEIQGSLGDMEFGIDYSELQPIISANGAGEPHASWDYEEAKGVRVQGSKWMYMLLKVPMGMRPVCATLDLIADVELKGSILQVVIGKRDVARIKLGVKLVS
jgi:hypothetical protein